jgi:hypothetical protein
VAITCETNARATGRTTRMLMRAVCAVASGKRVIIVSPSRSNVLYMQGILRDAGYDADGVRFVTVDGVRSLAQQAFPDSVRFFYDHAALDAAMQGDSGHWEVRRVLDEKGLLAE